MGGGWGSGRRDKEGYYIGGGRRWRCGRRGGALGDESVCFSTLLPRSLISNHLFMPGWKGIKGGGSRKKNERGAVKLERVPDI